MIPAPAFLTNPERFMAFSRWAAPLIGAMAVVLAAAGLWLAFGAPEDYQQGDTVRIMFIHVPAAWIGMFAYLCLGVASFLALVFRHALADAAAAAAAPLGAAFTFLALVTGSLWGRPMWGTWWVWDARLTSVLVLFFLYLGYMALSEAFDDEQRGLRAASILALVGFINVPVIKFSVEWWNTLHQPASVMKMGGPSIHASMLWPLLLMALAFKAYYVVVVLMRIRAELAARRVRAVRIALATAAS
jgi:heme exporter protein C